MDAESYTNLTFSGLLGLFLAIEIFMVAWAVIHWLRARSLWSQVIKREQLDTDRIWSRVKVWSTKPEYALRNLFPRHVYAMMYVDDGSIHLEAQDPVNGHLITTFNRATVATHWCRDRIEFKSQSGSVQVKAVGAGLPVSSPQLTDAFWHQLQPDCWDPFINESRSFESCADRRSKLAILILGVIALVAVIEFVFLNTYWLVDARPYASLWWIPVFATIPWLIWMLRDQVPALEATATALMLAVSVSLVGYIGVKRADQWFGGQTQYQYVLAMNGGRELVPVGADGPVIQLRYANNSWDDIALGSKHSVIVRGGVLGTAQVNFAQLIPNTTASHD